RCQLRNKPPRATASVVLLVSGRWERDDAGSWPEIARGDSSRRVLPIVIRGVRTTPGPMTLVIDLGYRWYPPRRRQGRSHERFPAGGTRTRASSTTDAKRYTLSESALVPSTDWCQLVPLTPPKGFDRSTPTAVVGTICPHRRRAYE